MKTKNTKQILNYFAKLKPDQTWSFSDSHEKQKSTYLTHSYHRYPAKFIPQIVERLIKEYADEKSIICDPFGGCGTTLVESKILGRESVGFDINPVAKLITEAKTEAINPVILEMETEKLLNSIGKKCDNFNVNPKLDFWIDKKMQNKLAGIYIPITKIKNRKIRKFFLCGFSHILKNCSIWLMKSIKPTRDLKKKIPDPREIFKSHIKSMLKKNEQFYNFLKSENKLNIKSKMRVADSRRIPTKKERVDLIITSPPYVTSYEYADLHQLSLLWFKFTDNLTEFRRNFIGTQSILDEKKTSNPIANNITKRLHKKDKSLAKKVGNYFEDVNLTIKEMYRILRKNGLVCLIVGNTTLKGVPILNAELAYEQMLRAGFKHEKVIKREIFNQMITPWRDKRDGRFTNKKNENKKRIYQYEFIIIMRK
ncbi:MAG: DNA methyltransferase [Candidatus Marinimicrobia bacterium]|nr:DNA methyltransferase [Candidatus Neomarinimicrobiota bacterium]MDD5489397.1 DNA methyltransferase [Candidatus Moranbacteria bacterium]